MAGVIPHLIVGISLFLVAEYNLKNFLKQEYKTNDHILLFSICLLFSIIPDFPIGLYYIFNISTWENLIVYHSYFHAIITPISLIALIIIIFFVKTKKQPIWIIGIICILIHIAMDLYIQEGSNWI